MKGIIVFVFMWSVAFPLNNNKTGQTFPKEIEDTALSSRRVRSLFRSAVRNSACHESIDEILQFLNENGKFHFPKENATLILGLTGAGKSTLSTALTSPEKLKTVEKSNGVYVLRDEQDLISSGSTLESKTLSPNLMIEKNGTYFYSYYDCPGFDDTRSAKHDIFAMFAIDTLLKTVNGVNFVITATFSAVNNEVADRDPFMKMAEHVLHLLKDVRNYRNSILFVATKVPNNIYIKKKIAYYTTDSEFIASIVMFFNTTKDYIIEKMPSMGEQIVELIDILLKRNRKGEYENIQIFRLAGDEVPITEMTLLTDELASIKSSIHEKPFIPTRTNEFGIQISVESQNCMRDLVDQMRTILISDIDKIDNDIDLFYRSIEERESESTEFREKIASAYRHLQPIEFTKNNFFVALKQIEDFARESNINIDASLPELQKHLDLIAFIKLYGNFTSTEKIFDFTTQLKTSVTYLSDTKEWYEFVIHLKDALPQYDAKQESTEGIVFEKEQTECLNAKIIGKTLAEIGFAKFLLQVDKLGYNRVSHIKLNPFNSRALKNVLTNQIDVILRAYVDRIEDEILKFYQQILEQNQDLNEVDQKLSLAYRDLQPIEFKVDNFLSSLQKLTDVAHKLGINISVSLSKLYKRKNMIEFFETFSRCNPHNISMRLDRSLTFLKDWNRWYEFAVGINSTSIDKFKQITGEMTCVELKKELGLLIGRIDPLSIVSNPIKFAAMGNILKKKMHAILQSDVAQIDKEIVKFYQRIEDQEKDLVNLQDIIESANDHLQPMVKLMEYDYSLFSKESAQVIEGLGINVDVPLFNLNYHLKWIDCFNTVGRSYEYNISAPLSKSVNYLCDTKASSLEKLLELWDNANVTDQFPIDTSPPQNIASVADYVIAAEKFFVLDSRTDVIIVLGLSGSGKSTVTSFLSGSVLISVEEPKNSKTFLIKDSQHLIPSSNSSIVSRTLIPNIFIDNENNVTFYDCPGFMDSRGIANDIATKFLIKKLVAHARSAKFVFTIPYDSVIFGREKQQFKLLLKHGISFIKNIDGYDNGIGLIVTKVNDPANDDTIFGKIGSFLESARSQLNEPSVIEKSMQHLIDIMLNKKANKYDRIKIHRTVTSPGLLKHMPEQQMEKEAMLDMIYNTLQYATIKDSDFGFSISDESRANIEPLIGQHIKDLKSTISGIGNEMVNFFFEEERKIKNISAFIDRMALTDQKLSNVQSEKDPILFRNKLLNVISFFNIGVPNEILERFKKQIEAIKFLKRLNIAVPESFNIFDGLTNIAQFISDSRKWYTFVIKLHDDLSASEKLYDAGNNNPNSFIDDIDRIISGRFDEKENADFSVSGNIFDKRSYGIENMKVNKFKLMVLKNIVKQTMNYDIQWKCDSNKLSVKGYNIKMSDVLGKQCNTKIIELFALNKIFLDENINKIGEQLTIVIIAPVWEVIGKSDFTLNGSHGEKYNVAAGDGSGRSDGKMGEPGKPGGSGGHFIGIGDTFLNIRNLRIFANGGTGGSGQDGGKGGDGQHGEDAPEVQGFIEFLTGFDNWIDLKGFEYSQTTMFEGDFHFKVYGKSDKRSGSGGDGGCGGLGGNGGQKFFLGLTQKPKIQFFSRKGDEGAAGIGGSGGKPTKNGDTANYTYPFLHTHWPSDLISYYLITPRQISKPGEWHYAEKGKDGGNCKSPTEAINVIFPLSKRTIEDYETFVRENLVNVNCLSNFAMRLNNNGKIRKMDNTLDFIYELQSLENQYNNLRNEINFRPYYESFLDRLNEYEKTVDASSEMRKVLGYLYAAAMSKISSNIENQSVILSLHDYLNEIEKMINDLRVNERDVQIANQRKQYTTSLNTQMESARNLIHGKILPQIDGTLKEIDSTIDKLIIDTIEMQNKTQKKIAEEEENKRKLVRSMSLRIMFTTLRTAASALALLGPHGAAVGAVVGAATLFVETITDDTSTSLSDSSAKLTFSIDKIEKERKHKNEMVKQQLADFSRELDSNANTRNYFDEIRKEIEQKIQDPDNKPIPDSWRKKMNTAVGEKIKQLKKANAANKIPELDAQLRKLDKYQTYSHILVNSMDTYNKIKDSVKQMKEADGAIDKLRVELEGWTMHEEKIYDVLIPTFGTIKNYFQSQSFEKDSRVELDIHKWEIKNRLRDIKRTFNQMIEITENQEEFSHCFDKIGAAMDILIDIYGRIDSLSDGSKFANYISQIASNGPVITNFTEIDDGIKSLNAMIQTNLVLEQHAFIIHAFKQHYFPFAPFFLDKFELPAKFKFTDTASLKEAAIKQIKEVNSGIVISETTLQTKDIDLFSKIMFHSNVSVRDLPPFYTWKNQEFNADVRKLLSGEEIVIFADIRKGLVENAIKFNEIGIYLRASDETVQSHLDAIIGHFEVAMTMFGKNYYRCQDRIYSMSTDGSIVIKHSMKYDSNGNPKKPNNLYDKMSKNNYFLSPYALWSIQLTNKNNEKTLKTFLDEKIDIELIGRGQYVSNTKYITEQVCTNKLDKYYTVESIF